MDTFDLVVIGAGPAGYVGAIRAAQLGMTVALVEKQYLGGTCLNVGCIPSKALLDATHQYHVARDRFAARGIRVGDISIDLASLMSFKDKVVRQLTGGVGSLIRKNKIEHIKGTATFTAANRIQVTGAGEPRMVEGKNILIATGSAPMGLPNVPFDGERILDSTGALALSEVPKRLFVVGAGAIGLELGSVWSRLGSQVVVIEVLDHIAPFADREVASQLQKSLEKQGITFRLSTKVIGVQTQNAEIGITLQSAAGTETVVADRALVSIGRRPATDSLDLPAAGLKTTARGAIEVDLHYQSHVPGIYAVGDCIGGAMLAHKASDEAIACVEQMKGIAGHVNYNAIPNIIYTAPELACVGLSEGAAREAGHEVKVGRFPFSANGRARCMDETDGMVKIIADARTDMVLGITILHAHASDLIAEAAIAMEYKASAEDIARSVHAHPTLSEAMKEAALAVDGRAIHN